MGKRSRRQGAAPERMATAAVAVLVVLLALPLSSRAQEVPSARPLSEEERQAVRLAALYFDGGAEAWWRELAAGSPLKRLGREAARLEMEVRAGPPRQARWELQTLDPSAPEGTAVFGLEFVSGLDDLLTLRLVEEDGRWKLYSLRILAEKDAAGRQPGPAARGEPVPAVPAPRGPVRLLWGVTAVLGLIGLTLLVRSRQSGSPAVIAGLAVVFLGVAAVAAAWLWRDAGPRERPASAADRELTAGPTPLAPLLPLRRALASSRAETVERLFATVSPAAPHAPVAALWQAHRSLANRDLDTVETILRDFQAPSPRPLAELLRARVSFLRSREVETALAFQRVVEQGPGHDGLRFEAAQAFYLMGFEDRARGYLEGLAAMGSRMAEVYYTLAELAVLDHDRYGAETLFLAGWELRPLERREIFAQPLLSALLDPRGPIYELFQLDRAAEPRVSPGSDVSLRPVPLPPPAEPRLSGKYLRIGFPDGELLVPGGAAVAPPGTPVDEAGAWRRVEEKKALSELPALLKASRGGGVPAQPRLRRQLETAISALASRNRWAEVVELTAGLSQALDNAPPELLQLRAKGLRHLERTEEAAALLVRVAKDNVVARRRDPWTLYQLADMLTVLGHHDVAIKLMLKADTQMPFPASDLRLLQVHMDKRVDLDYLTHASDHFELRYPPGRGHLAEGMARILEAERQRLRRWIPLQSDRRTEVHLLSYEEFRGSYAGGMDLLGLYDGRIRVPLADAWSFHPFVVGILSHELAHAMIAEYTENQAPRWFHEGLAQHVEMGPAVVNPIPDYARQARLLAFPVVEDVLQGFPYPHLVATAYDESAWALHYLEEQFGVATIHRLLERFKAGDTTRQALEEVLDVSAAEFDRRLRQWWLGDAPLAWSTEVVRYDAPASLLSRSRGERAVAVPASLRRKWWEGY